MNYKEYYDLIKPTYITWEFYNKYIDYNIPFGAIGDIVDCRTYRRFVPELNRRERAIEAFLRVVEYNIKLVNHLQPFDVLQEEAELMFDSLVNLKMLPSNRSRWTGGTKSVELNPSSIFNCSFCAVNRLEVFGEIFELLCLGVGVGYRVFYRDINALPNITNRKFHLVHKEYTPLPKQLREEHTTYYERDGVLRVTIGDSRQGWKDALMLIINVSLHDKYKNITLIEFDYDSVRPFGERILGFGGTASGHEALKSILVDVFNIITKCPDDRLRTLDCLDIPCVIARGVVAGSSRRSALMVWFEEDDELCANAKVNIPCDKTYRYQANITSCVGSLYYDEFLDFLINTKPNEAEVIAYINSVKPPFEYFQRRFKQMESLGEPGINNFLWLVYKRWLGVIAHRPDEVDVFKYLDICTNPCSEIVGTTGLNRNSGGFCVSGDTLLITNDGLHPIKEVVNQDVQVWNGKKWSTVVPIKTGENQQLVRVTFSDGSYLDTTEYHRFSIAYKRQEYKQFYEVEARDIKLDNGNVITEPYQIEYLNGESKDSKWAYTLGVLLGDGSLYAESSGKTRINLTLYGNKKSLPVLGVKSEERLLKGYSDTHIDVSELKKHFDYSWTYNFKENDDSLLQLASWSKDSILAFIAGLADTDGSNTDNGGIRIYLNSYRKCQIIQLLLTKCGIKSSVNLMSKKGEFTNFGTRKTDIYYLQITECNNIPCFRLDISKGHSCKFKGKYQLIKSIELLDGLHDTYCFEELEEHKAVFGNTLTYQCNLTTNNLLSFVKLDVNNKYYFDYQNAKKTTELITRIGLRQTEVVIPMSGWNETQREERLLGVDTTCGFQDVCTSLGWSYDSPEASELRIKLRKWANDEATRYATELNVPRPLLVTTSKPNGATAQVLGTASGIHWNWSKYYLRRVTATSTDPLALTLLQQGFKCYPGVYELDKVDEYIHQLPFIPRIKYKLLQRWNKLNTFHRLEIFNLLLPSVQRHIIDKCNTIVFEFPVKTNANVSANDVSALDQLESQRLFSVENTDHMPSITITVKKNEWNSVTKWVYDNWTNGFNTAAFLSYDGKTYPLLPFQTITEKEYQRHLEPVKHNAVSNWNNNGIHFKLDTDLLDYYEALLQAQKDDNDLIVEACEVGGSCPSR